MSTASTRPAFEVHSESTQSDTLLVGLSEHGLAGLTAADYLVGQLDLEQVGHILVDQLPAITPFENGTPRHHTRLYSRPDLPVTVLVGELFVPPIAAKPFAEAVLSWGAEDDVGEIVVLSGVPVAHGPDEHRPYYVASPDYREARLADLPAPVPQSGHYEAVDAASAPDAAGEVPPEREGPSGERTAEGEEIPGAVPVPMGGGYLDGVNAALMAEGLQSPLRTCVFTTPSHPQAPDAEAAIHLLEAVTTVYDLSVDVAPLRAFAERVSAHYEELAARVEAAREEQPPHDDRMYM